jgi:hypothetical protein
VSTLFAELAEAHARLAELYQRQAAANANDNADKWISQRDSVLSSRRHINATRRRVSQGLPDARIVGRRYLLTQAAVDAELGHLTGRVRATVERVPAVDELANLRARYSNASTNPARKTA